MPELPDVEVLRREVADETVGEVIRSMTIGIPRMIKFIHLDELRRRLKGAVITATSRHGKNLFLKTKRGPFLRFHFGMTGVLRYEGDSLPLAKHTCLALHLQNGKRLVFIDPRRFGAVEFIESFDDFLHKAHIGPDIEALGLKDFEELLRQKTGQLKLALMDQSLMCGLGSVYTDEVLFQAKLHPEARIPDLSHKEITLLYKKMKTIIRTAIKDHASREQMPSTYLIQHRHSGDVCPHCKKGKIHMKSIGGRAS